MVKSCKIIWVFGSSGAGKETFIRKMTTNPPVALIEHFGWENLHVIPISESIKYVGKQPHDPIISKRKLIIPAVIKSINQEDLLILIKGQDTDLEMGLVNKLKQTITHAEHRILYLHVDPKIVLGRWKHKVWWKEEYSLKTVKTWLKYQLNLLSRLVGIQIDAIQIKNKKINFFKFPPKL